MTGRRVSELLRKHSSLHFDLVDAAWSFKVVDHLRLRLASFENYINGSNIDIVTDHSLVKDVLNTLCHSIPMYSPFGAVSELHEIPFISKSDLLQYPDKILDTSIPYFWSKTTSGTTGRPLQIFYSPEFFIEQRFLDIPKIFARYYFERPRLSQPFSVVHITDTSNMQASIFLSPLDSSMIVYLPISTFNFDEILADVSPDFVSARPEILVQFTEIIMQQGQNLKALISAGSKLTLERRQQVESRTNVPCIDVYALSEFGLVASECSFGKLHIDETSVLVEIIDGTSQRLSDGLNGEVVISSTRNAAEPLLRYRTGDIGSIDRNACSCGQLGAKLCLVQGRLVPTFCFDGTVVIPTCFNDLPSLFDVDDFQVVQSGERQLQINVQPRLVHMESSFIPELTTYAQKKLPKQVQVSVHIVRFDSIKKRERYIQHLF